MEYYAGTFEAVYVLLHPFIKPLSIPRHLFAPGTYPNRASIVRGCEPVLWEDARRRTGLPSIAAVDVGLRTLISGLREEFSNQSYADKILALAETDGIIHPDEGRFSDLLHDTVLHSIQSLGYEWVWVGDEFGTERKLHWIDDLTGQEAGPTIGLCNVFTPDKQLLWTTHWDSHFSFLCSSERNLGTIQGNFHFEGFFCSPTTEVYRSVHP